jgi:S1-C subfamily serine protease
LRRRKMNLTQAIENAMSRCVTVSAGNAEGSGVIITTGIILTCFHCLKVDNGIKVNDFNAKVVAVDPTHDLILLSVPTDEFETVRLCDVGLGQQVLTVGNPLSMVKALLFGRVIYQTEKRLIHDTHGAPGISGSGLWDNEGKLVGVNHSVLGAKHIGSHYTIAVPAEMFHDTLAEVFNIVSPTTEEVEKYGTKETGQKVPPPHSQ